MVKKYDTADYVIGAGVTIVDNKVFRLVIRLFLTLATFTLLFLWHQY